VEVITNPDPEGGDRLVRHRVEEPFSSVGEDFVSDSSVTVTPIFDELVEEFRKRETPPERSVQDPSPQRDPPQPDRSSG
jgi:hypothetical protein